MQARHIILHYHIFKNAGSTIEWILRKNFRRSFGTIHELGVDDILSNEEIVKFCQEHPEVAALSSHHFRLPGPRSATCHFVEWCFIRHPLDRIQSMYYYFRNLNTPSDDYSQQARSADLNGFIEWSIENQPFNAVNSQTCFCSMSGEYYFPPAATNLKDAKSAIQNMKVLGIVERFDESLVAAEFFLRFIFPDLDFSYVRQNASRPANTDLSQRLDDMKMRCGTALYTEIERLNEFDDELWQYASQELDRRIAYIPNFDQRLQSFRKRCEIWQLLDMSNNRRAAQVD